MLTRAPECPRDLLFVADDVLGGAFVIDGGGFGGQVAARRAVGTVHYWAPDTLAWESLDLGYSDFLAWALQGDLAAFYGDWRWHGWQQEVAALPGDVGLHVHPPLWTEGPPIGARSRRAIPMAELLALELDVGRQLHRHE